MSPNQLNAYHASEHSTFVVASGDYGYDEEGSGDPGEGWPESLPDAFAVGGTALFHASNARGWSERVWDEPVSGAPEDYATGTNSGCSPLQPKPAWQTDKGCAHRMENDLAAVGACETPVSIYVTPYQDTGEWTDVCGTSASAPLVAGILAHAGWGVRSLGVKALYERPGTLFDVTEGSNTAFVAKPCQPPLVEAADEYFCHAEVGYDGPTGLGTPDGIPGAGVLPPSITKVEPAAGLQAGGTKVTITGAAFEEVTAVKFGATNAASYTVESPDTITAVSSAGTGTVGVSVTSSEGTSVPSAADDFTYLAAGPAPTVTKLAPKTGPATGGTSVMITGTNFTGVTKVAFGAVAAKSFKLNSATSVTAESPAGTGTVGVTVTTANGTSPASSKDHYKYKKAKVKK